jgi:hypothetical protein
MKESRHFFCLYPSLSARGREEKKDTTEVGSKYFTNFIAFREKVAHNVTEYIRVGTST